MLKVLIFCIVGYAAFSLGTLGFAQIIGSLRTIRVRGIGMTLSTTVLWTAILGIALFLVLKFIPQYKIAIYIGYGMSFLIILCQKDIE